MDAPALAPLFSEIIPEDVLSEEVYAMLGLPAPGYRAATRDLRPSSFAALCCAGLAPRLSSCADGGFMAGEAQQPDGDGAGAELGVEPLADEEDPPLEPIELVWQAAQETVRDHYRRRAHPALLADERWAQQHGLRKTHLSHLRGKLGLAEDEVEACVRRLRHALSHLARWRAGALEGYGYTGQEPDERTGPLCTCLLRASADTILRLQDSQHRRRVAALLRRLGARHFPFGALTPLAGEPDSMPPMPALRWLMLPPTPPPGVVDEALWHAEAAAADLPEEAPFRSRRECHEWLACALRHAGSAPRLAFAALGRLDPAQRAAATLPRDAAAWLDAGPGAGKTATMAARAAHLVAACGAAPRDVVPLTFTRIARDALAERLADLGCDGVEAKTIDSFVLGLLHHLRGIADVRPAGGATAAGGDAENEVKRRMQAALAKAAAASRGGSQPAAFAAPAKSVAGKLLEALGVAARRAGVFSWGDTAPLVPELIRVQWKWGADEAGAAQQLCLHTHPGMLAALRALRESLAPDVESGACALLSDQTLLLLALLRAAAGEPSPAPAGDHAPAWVASLGGHALKAVDQARRALARRHYLLDEAQDTDASQIAVLRLVAGAGGVTAVGDCDQALYAFRGAGGGQVASQFAAAFPLTRRLELSANYRSSPAIVACCAAVVAPLPPPRKGLASRWAEGRRWHKVTLVSCGGSGRNGAPSDVELAEVCRLAAALPPNSTAAALCYTKAQVAALEEAVSRGPALAIGNGLAVSTIHKAKGLEYDAVIVWATGDAWTGLRKHYAPDDLAPSGDREAWRADERRLMYVALSRARSRLYVLYSGSPSVCVNELARPSMGAWVELTDTAQ